MQNIILVGLGFMGAMHVQSYRQLKNANVVAIVDGAPERAGKTLAEIGLDVPVFATLAEAFAAVDADVVDVCVPTDAHAGYAVEALEAGKHVFVEKPFALTVAEAEAVIAAAEKADRALQVGQCIRFWPEYQALAKLYASGEYGAIKSLVLTRRASRPGYSEGNWLNDEKRSGGAALDLHIHDTDFVLHLLGRPQSVTSRGTRDVSGIDHIVTQYGFDDIVVHAEGGWNYPEKWGFQMAYQAIFEKAVIDFDSNASPTLLVTEASGEKRPLPFDAPSAGEATAGGGNLSSLGGYYNELAYFIEQLEAGVKPEIATGRQALESLEVVLAELKSVEQNGAVVTL